MAKVSVIVPVYNVEEYIEKCLTSLVKQTITDIEIIVVNDGSPDNSQKIIDKFAKKYPKKIKAYVKKNGGLSDARNYGLKKATGEYIGFVDSDDFVNEDMFEKLYTKAKTEDFDVVVCDINCVYTNKTDIISSLIKDDIITEKDARKQMTNIYPAAWNKIYKRDLFKYGVNFKKGVWYEDVEFLYKLYPYIKKIGVVSEPLINYVQRDGAITRTFDKRLYHYIDNWDGIIEYYKKNDFYDKYKNELEYCYVRYIYATFIKGACNFPKNEFNNAVNIAINRVNSTFPNYKKNPYLKGGLKNLYLKYFTPLSANAIYLLFHLKCEKN